MSNEKQSIGLSFGILSEPISEQLKKQGYEYDVKKVEQFEREVEAVNILRFGSNLLTDSIVDKCFLKLHKAVVAHVAKKNGLTVTKSPA